MIDDFRFGRVTVIGDLLLDQYISGSVSRISPEAPVPVVLHDDFRLVPGGAANVAVNAAALGAEVRLVGLVGEDDAARQLRAALQDRRGVRLEGIVSSPDWTTITKTRIVSGRQQIVRIDVEKILPLEKETRQALIRAAEEAIVESDVVVCSDYAKGVLDDDVLKAVIAAGRARGIPVIVDPKRPTFEAYRGATLITPNRLEAEQASGLPVRTDAEVLQVAETLSGQFGGDVLVTRSEDGMTLWRRTGNATHVATRRTEVFDVSGAGDTVVATVAAVLSAGQPLETAVVIATAAASISVSKLGTAVVSREELTRELLQEIPESGALVPLQQAVRIVEDWHRHGAKVVFTNGCFDLLHPGHVALIQAAAREGDRLIVALNTDRSVSHLKGPSRPIQSEQARATVMGALRQVDLVVLFDEETPLETIRALQPDVLVKGADYTEDQVVGADVVKARGGRVVLAQLVAGQSTTRLVSETRKTPA
ncbi:D-glycero-beta-D-manno-heptose-7-phosphate kinase [Gluconobacter morbifer]|uniref:Bifunctional protein HldE n=1 Tax=Gluconobacter morbifer G707 TaxID=1088869 RepID=G6XK81_9PROT|nr:D-glycero-beta-D-manno-heptose-7-phosphate kinase [Gluconobacter morbifer]EHH67677.1 protein RfaE (involved in ADP-L-glycero-D-manno-heptose synthesis) [Gluconobacter morbifer G707]